MAFLKALKQVDGWQDLALTEAAQTVQVLIGRTLWSAARPGPTLSTEARLCQKR